MSGPDFPFPQIATGDLDVPIVGQLPAAHLPFGDGRFAPDSLLEGAGLELPVPDQKVAASGERQRGRAFLNVPHAAGTWSSNLLCSSGESCANLPASIRAG